MRPAFLNVSLFASFLLILFTGWLFFSPIGKLNNAPINKRFSIVINKPYFVAKDGKTLLVYDRIFYNEAEKHLNLTEGKICLYDKYRAEFCSSGQVDYFLGPSSDIVQTNQYFVLKEDTVEIQMSYKGEFSDGAKGVNKLVLLLDENRKITVKEGAPLQFDVIR